MPKISLVILVLVALAACNAAPRKLQVQEIPNACYTATIGMTKYHMALRKMDRRRTQNLNEAEVDIKSKATASRPSIIEDPSWCVNESKYQNRSRRLSGSRRLQTWGINQCFSKKGLIYYGPDKDGFRHECPTVLSALNDLSRNFWCMPCKAE